MPSLLVVCPFASLAVVLLRLLFSLLFYRLDLCSRKNFFTIAQHPYPASSLPSINGKQTRLVSFLSSVVFFISKMCAKSPSVLQVSRVRVIRVWLSSCWSVMTLRKLEWALIGNGDMTRLCTRTSARARYVYSVNYLITFFYYRFIIDKSARPNARSPDLNFPISIH